jgi:hypothetical protein
MTAWTSSTASAAPASSDAMTATLNASVAVLATARSSDVASGNAADLAPALLSRDGVSVLFAFAMVSLLLLTGPLDLVPIVDLFVEASRRYRAAAVPLSSYAV